MATVRDRENRPPDAVRGVESPEPAALEGRVERPLLGFGVLGAPAAFGLVSLTAILLASGRCVASGRITGIAGISSTQQVMGFITVIGALVAGAAGVASWRAWRLTRRSAVPAAGGNLRPIPVWALGGLFLSSMFFLLIVLIGGLEVVLNVTTCS